MKKIYFTISLFACLLLFSNLDLKEGPSFLSEKMPVQEALAELGGEQPTHRPRKDIEGVSKAHGEALVLKGWTKNPNGSGKTDRVSKHFVCTSCHNVERDEPNLLTVDPMARLKYVNEKGLPFLQGSSLYGIVDRRNFYNGDYEKKYGDLVEPARKDLRQAIHLCATECAQGRPLEVWEMESVLEYLWSIGLKLGDLDLSDDEWKMLEKGIVNKKEQDKALTMLESKYLKGMPATFLDPPSDRKAGFSNEGNPATGKMIYELSCLHCHDQKRYSFFNMDRSDMTFDFLEKHISVYTRYSIYQVSRYGTSPIPWKKAYMPQYTKEKMSEQMLEDLRVYIEQEAK